MVSSWTALALRVLSLTSKSAHNAPVSFSCVPDDKMTERNRLTLLLTCILFCGCTLDIYCIDCCCENVISFLCMCLLWLRSCVDLLRVLFSCSNGNGDFWRLNVNYGSVPLEKAHGDSRHNSRDSLQDHSSKKEDITKYVFEFCSVALFVILLVYLSSYACCCTCVCMRLNACCLVPFCGV